MGNICCGEEFSTKSSLITRRRCPDISAMKKDYQHLLQSLLNSAINKFDQRYSIQQFDIKGMIGKGGQAQVYLIELVQTITDSHYKTHETSAMQIETKTFAMKRVAKNRQSACQLQKSEGQLQSFMLEKQIMSCEWDVCPFISSISYSCQDNYYLYYIMDLATGGDAYSLIHSDNHTGKPFEFSELGEQAVKFLIAGCIIGLKSLHRKKIVYRDLKPQNLLIYEDGYPKLADFGVAKVLECSDDDLCQEECQPQLFYDIQGTLLYLAPEIMEGAGYNFGADLWALGILSYQLILKTTPFTRQIIKSPKFGQRVKDFQNKKCHNLFFKNNFISDEAKDFISSLLRYEPTKRLGYKSSKQLKSHKFFKGFDWKAYEAKTISSPLEKLVKKYPIVVTPLQDIPERDRIGLHLLGITKEDSTQLPFTYVKSRSKFVPISGETRVSDNEELLKS